MARSPAPRCRASGSPQTSTQIRACGRILPLSSASSRAHSLPRASMCAAACPESQPVRPFAVPPKPVGPQPLLRSSSTTAFGRELPMSPSSRPAAGEKIRRVAPDSSSSLREVIGRFNCLSLSSRSQKSQHLRQRQRRCPSAAPRIISTDRRHAPPEASSPIAFSPSHCCRVGKHSIRSSGLSKSFAPTSGKFSPPTRRVAVTPFALRCSRASTKLLCVSPGATHAITSRVIGPQPPNHPGQPFRHFIVHLDIRAPLLVAPAPLRLGNRDPLKSFRHGDTAFPRASNNPGSRRRDAGDGAFL